jgi:hypothetical protein
MGSGDGPDQSRIKIWRGDLRSLWPAKQAANGYLKEVIAADRPFADLFDDFVDNAHRLCFNDLLHKDLHTVIGNYLIHGFFGRVSQGRLGQSATAVVFRPAHGSPTLHLAIAAIHRLAEALPDGSKHSLGTYRPEQEIDGAGQTVANTGQEANRRTGPGTGIDHHAQHEMA